MKKLARGPVLMVCSLLLACDESGRDPTRPESGGPPAANATRIVDVPAAGGARASGHADIHGTPVQNVRDEIFSFTAVSTNSPPLAKGQVTVHYVRFTGEEVAVWAEVTCLSVVGNEAWVGALVRRFVFDGQEQPALAGRPMIFRLRDMGEGQGVTDLASLVFFPPAPGDQLTHCITRPAFPILRESTNGNIQVEPD